MHDEKHHHHRHHGHEHHEEKPDKDKLIKRIAHWKHHNEDHLESYEDWAGKAKAMGYEDIGDLLKEVCRKTEEQNKLFARMLEILESE